MKITRIKNSITVVLEDGTLLTSNICTDEMHEDVIANINNEEAVKAIIMPNYAEKKDDINNKLDMLANYDKSEYLTVIGNSMYIKSIADLSLPQDLAVAIWNAEQNDELELLSTYLNFWTLAALNKDPEARQNLFWFLTRYGMSISSSGLFVAYRNVKLYSKGESIDAPLAKFITESFTKVRHRLKKNPKNYIIGRDLDGEFICSSSENRVDVQLGMLDIMYKALSDIETAPIYTDGYTGKFRIRIGEPVTMPRERCDTNQSNTCSRGLHVAGKSWLQSNYFGDTGLRVLVNPSDVVAVPPEDSYGKMRVCAYYPVGIVGFDESGKILDERIEDGFEDNFIDMISYVGETNNEEVSKYSITVPSIPELSRNRIMDRMEDIKASLKLKHQYPNG
tara:strand:+ start:11919 stop:13097 length:1179 start_codon:yes stop_codon:yes gene_type:complete